MMNYYYLRRITYNSNRRKTLIALDTDKFVVGRSKTCNYVIRSGLISRKHALFIKCSDDWFVKNLSTNWLFLENEKIPRKEKRNIKNGSFISLGFSNDFQYEFIVTSVKYEESLMIESLQDIRKFKVVISKLNEEKENFESQVEKLSNVMEDEFQCSICKELFITAITLNCSHTFCKHCLDTWKNTEVNCPNCRQSITSEVRCIVIDNFVEKAVSALSETMKKKRNQIIAQRKIEVEAAKARDPPAPVGLEVFYNDSSTSYDSPPRVNLDTFPMEIYLSADASSTNSD